MEPFQQASSFHIYYCPRLRATKRMQSTVAFLLAVLAPFRDQTCCRNTTDTSVSVFAAAMFVQQVVVHFSMTHFDASNTKMKGNGVSDLAVMTPPSPNQTRRRLHGCGSASIHRQSCRSRKRQSHWGRRVWLRQKRRWPFLLMSRQPSIRK